MNIYVGNLPHSTTEAELKAAFENYGSVSSVALIKDKDTGRSRGFGFVEMPDDAEARAAIDALNGEDFGGRDLTVNEAKPREARPQGRGYSGGGQRGGSGGGRGGERRGPKGDSGYDRSKGKGRRW